MKALLLDDCRNCPHFVATANHQSEDSYNAKCSHPESTSSEWLQRISRTPNPESHGCPLPDYIEPKETIYY